MDSSDLVEESSFSVLVTRLNAEESSELSSDFVELSFVSVLITRTRAEERSVLVDESSVLVDDRVCFHGGKL